MKFVEADGLPTVPPIFGYVNFGTALNFGTQLWKMTAFPKQETFVSIFSLAPTCGTRSS